MVMVRDTTGSSCSEISARTVPGRSLDPAAPTRGAKSSRCVKTGAMLFQVGGRRQLYQVERGALCHYINWPDGRHEVIEFAFAGEIVGLGALSEHVSTAQAMVDTRVRPIDEASFAELCRGDDRLELRAASAMDREFDFVRQRARSSAVVTPSQKVARYLSALVSIAVNEGSVQALGAEDTVSGVVADRLGLDIDALSSALLDLKRRGLVDTSKAGNLIVKDCRALEIFGDAK